MKQIDGLVTKDEIYRLISGFRTRFKISEEAAHEMAKRVAEMPTVEAEPKDIYSKLLREVLPILRAAIFVNHVQTKAADELYDKIIKAVRE